MADSATPYCMRCEDLGRDIDIAICFEKDCPYSSDCEIFKERKYFEENVLYHISRIDKELNRAC